MSDEENLEWILDEGIVLPVKKTGPISCNFCGKSNREVMKIIAGAGVFICDECIRLCVDMIREDSPDFAMPTA